MIALYLSAIESEDEKNKIIYIYNNYHSIMCFMRIITIPFSALILRLATMTFRLNSDRITEASVF